MTNKTQDRKLNIFDFRKKRFNLKDLPKDVQDDLRKESVVYGSLDGKEPSYTSHGIDEEWGNDFIKLHSFWAGYRFKTKDFCDVMNIYYAIHDLRTNEIHQFCGGDWWKMKEKLAELMG